MTESALETRLRRVTDLFVEGETIFLGREDDGTPICIWLNKMNPFEEEEARRDGQAHRGLRMAALQAEDSPERQGLTAEMALWDTDTLAVKYVTLRSDELMAEIYDDLYADTELTEKMRQAQRLPQLLKDSGVPEEDPRWAEIDRLNAEWMKAFDDKRKQVVREAEADAKSQVREDLEKAYVAEWASKSSMAEFINERRVTALWLSMRDCVATEREDKGPNDPDRWDHSRCDHSVKLVAERSGVSKLPSGVLEKVTVVAEALPVPTKEAGNSDAPASSSASSEPSDAEAEASTVSTQEGTPPDAPTT